MDLPTPCSLLMFVCFLVKNARGICNGIRGEGQGRTVSVRHHAPHQGHIQEVKEHAGADDEDEHESPVNGTFLFG